MPETTRQYDITGMHCTGCAANLERKLAQIPGVVRAKVDFAQGQAEVAADWRQLTDDIVFESTAKLGFSARRRTENAASPNPAPPDREFWVVCINLLTAAVLIALTFCHFHGHFALWLGLNAALLLPCLIGNAKKLYYGLLALIRGIPDMNSLVAVGVLGALLGGVFAPDGHGHFDAVPMILAFTSLGKYLEQRARRRALSQLNTLTSLLPQFALKLGLDGKTERVPVSALAVGDRVRLIPGDRVPADGVVVADLAYIDQSMFTGEPLSVEAGPGTAVLGGSLCRDGVAVIEITQTGQDALLNRIIALVRTAQSSKPRIGRFADRASRYFVWGILLLALLTLAGHLLAGNTAFSAFNYALAVTVVSCPCALALATPAALICGIGRAAREKILVKNAEVLEKTAQHPLVAFDKTGTLTNGRPMLTEIRLAPTSEMTENEFVTLLNSLESNSLHPVKFAIATELARRNLPNEPAEITDFKLYPGRGISGRLDGVTYLVGSARLLAEHRIAVPVDVPVAGTVFFAAAHDRYLGCVVLGDELRSEARSALAELRQLGLKTLLLSGDRKTTASATAQRLGIDESFGELLPQDKLRLIRERQQQGQLLAMVGDGVNDAPALMQADIGIAIGSATAAALDAADAVILNDDLRQLPRLFRLSSQCLRIIRQNLFWAVIYNLAAIPAAAGLLPGVAIPPAYCALAMAASSLCVMANSLRLTRCKL